MHHPQRYGGCWFSQLWFFILERIRDFLLSSIPSPALLRYLAALAFLHNPNCNFSSIIKRQHDLILLILVGHGPLHCIVWFNIPYLLQKCVTWQNTSWNSSCISEHFYHSNGCQFRTKCRLPDIHETAAQEVVMELSVNTASNRRSNLWQGLKVILHASDAPTWII